MSRPSYTRLVLTPYMSMLPAIGPQMTIRKGTILLAMRGVVISFVVGLGILAALVAADRPHWFGFQPKAAHAATDTSASARSLKMARRADGWPNWHADRRAR